MFISNQNNGFPYSFCIEHTNRRPYIEYTKSTASFIVSAFARDATQLSTSEATFRYVALQADNFFNSMTSHFRFT